MISTMLPCAPLEHMADAESSIRGADGLLCLNISPFHFRREQSSTMAGEATDRCNCKFTVTDLIKMITLSVTDWTGHWRGYACIHTSLYNVPDLRTQAHLTHVPVR